MARRKKHEEHENHERWLVSYADFITLLFAFFVVMYATSNNNLEKQKKFEESVRAEFKLNGPKAGGKTGPGTMAEQAIGDVIEPLDLLLKKGIGNKELEDHVQRLLEKNTEKAEIKKTATDTRHDSIGVRITLAASTLFPSGSAKLRSSSLKSIDKIAEILKKSPKRLVIEGHTDNQPLQGGLFETNWELAAARASQVLRYLVKVHGFDPSRVAAISYGEFKPIDSNDTEEGRSRNRRVELLIVNNESESETRD